MPSKVVEAELSANVAPSGTFFTTYPNGFSRADFQEDGDHALFVEQFPRPFTIAFGASGVTVTNGDTRTWRAGDRFFLGLDLNQAEGSEVDASRIYVSDIPDGLTPASPRLNDVLDALAEGGGVGGGSGDMEAATYDPNGVEDDAFDRANHTGAQAISTVTGLQTALDGKAAASALTAETNTRVAADAALDTRVSALEGASPGGGGAADVSFNGSVVVSEASQIDFSGAAVGSVTDEGSGRVNIVINQSPSGSGDAVRRNVNSFVGANFTAKLEDAIDSGEPIDVPAGAQQLANPIDVPSSGVDIQGAGDGLRHAGGTLLIGAPGADIFRVLNNTPVQARPAGQNTIDISRMGLRLTPDGNNTRSATQRCTATGYGIGICAIVYARSDWPTETTTTRSISNAWNHSHTRIFDLTFDVLNGSSVDHGCGGFHSQGTTYGSRFWNLDSAGGQSTTRRGVHSVLTIAQPYVQRVTCDAGTDVISTASTNPFLNNQRVVIRAHDATGTRPGGINFDTVYHVVNRTSGGFQIATSQGGSPVNITSAGSGFIYAILVGDAGAVFSPDEVKIDGISHYNGKLSVSVCNPERLTLGSLTSYGVETILEIPGLLSTASRTRAVGVDIRSVYSESPQATAGNANSECVLIDTDGGSIGYFQGRGADTGSQPIYRFAGSDLEIGNFDGRSSFSQGGVDLRVEGTNMMIFGQAHASSTVTTQSDTVGRLRNAGGSGFHFQRNFV